MTASSRNKLYRNTRDAKVMGVCAGLADYLDVRVCVIRFLTILGIIFSGGWLIALYIVMGLILDPKPDYLYAEDDERAARREATKPHAYKPRYRERRRQRREARKERRYWQKENPTTPNYDTRDIKRRFAEIEKRAQKLEAYLTSKKFRLDRELRGLED